MYMIRQFSVSLFWIGDFADSNLMCKFLFVYLWWNPRITGNQLIRASWDRYIEVRYEQQSAGGTSLTKNRPPSWCSDQILMLCETMTLKGNIGKCVTSVRNYPKVNLFLYWHSLIIMRKSVVKYLHLQMP